MNTKTTSAEWMILAPCLLAFGYVALIWNQLPATIVSHYGLSGKPDGWMPKENALLILTVATGLTYLLLRFLPRIDPKGRTQSALFLRIRFVVSLLLAATLTGLFYMANPTGGSRPGVGGLLALTCVAVAVLGNYMTTLRPNWVIGIRTPWTLVNDRVWTRTHRLGGRLMMVGGLLGALLALLVPAPYTVGAVVAALLVVSLIPVVYSYVYFRQEKAHQSLS